MPLFLAGLLVRGGVLPPQMVEEALQRQVLAGGALDSSLLELGAIEEPQLATYLCRASGLPLAQSEQLVAPDPRLRRLFPLRLAERHGLVPFAQEERTLRMACAYPADAALLEEMGFLLSQKIEAYVAPEFRVRLAIERLYEQAATARMHELARRCGAKTAPPPPPAPGAAQPASDPSRGLPPNWTVAEALARLEAAPNRDEAIEVALRFGRRSFAYVALFGVMGGKAIGWDALGEEPGVERRVEQVVQPLSEESVLATVVRTRGRYLGPLSATDANERLLEQMGRPVPQTAFVHPVEVSDRTVALVWADNGPEPVPPIAAAEAMVVVQALGHALERLIRGRKVAVLQVAAEAAQNPGSTAPDPGDVPENRAQQESSPSEPARTGAQPTAPGAADRSSAADHQGSAQARPTKAAAGREAGSSAPEADDPAHRSTATAAPPTARSSIETQPVAMTSGTEEIRRPRPSATSSIALRQACAGVEILLAASTDQERAEGLALVAGSGSVGAELLVALLPGPLRTDAAGEVCGGIILDALSALGAWAVPALSRGARSPSSSMRYWVAVLLSGSGDSAAHAALARLASDPDPHVAAIARTAAQPAA